MGLTSWNGYFEAVSQLRGTKIGPHGGTTTTGETEFEEKLGLATEGFIYHENLVKFSLAGVFGLVQRQYSQDIGNGPEDFNRNGTLDGFDVATTVFGRKSYPLNLFAHRSQQLTSREFRSSVELTSDDYGLNWNLSEDPLTVALQVDYRRLRLVPLDTDEEDGLQNNFLIDLDSEYKFDDHHRLRFRYRHEWDEEQPVRLEILSDRIMVDDAYDFGEREANRLDSSASFQEQSGTNDIEDLTFRENLRLEHEKNLHSQYLVGFTRQSRGSSRYDVPTLTENRYDVSALVEHRLFRSLTSRGEVVTRYDEYDPSATSLENGGHGTLDYRKLNPLGTLHLGYRGGFIRRDRNAGQSQLVDVRDERHTFSDPFPVRLNNERVDPLSIYVTAADGFTVFHETTDYHLNQVGNALEIERVVGGSIPNGTLVLVDYIYDQGGKYRLDSWDQSFRFRQDFDFGAGVYYRHEWQDQHTDLKAGTSVLAEDINADIVGIDDQLGDLHLDAEYEDRVSNIDSYRTYTASGAWSFSPVEAGQGSLGLSWTRRLHSEPVRRTTNFIGGTLTYEQRIDEGLHTNIAFAYRKGRDSITGNDEGFDLTGGLEWKIGQTLIRVAGEWNNFDSTYNLSDSWLVRIQLRRDF